MRIIKQEVQEVMQIPYSTEGTFKHIEKMGRICYQSQDKITNESTKKFVKMLFVRGHHAMLEHSNLVVNIPTAGLSLLELGDLYKALNSNFIYKTPYGNKTILVYGNWRAWADHLSITNFDDFINLKKKVLDYIVFFGFDKAHLIENIKNTPEFAKAYSVILKTDRAVTHELVRHRICGLAQESQRYCAYREELEFILPYMYDEYVDNVPDTKDPKLMRFSMWVEAMRQAEKHYKTLLELGEKPQEARSVLPNSTATQIGVTAYINEWTHIFKLRTAKDAYPQIKRLMESVKQGFTEKGWINGPRTK